MKIIAATVILFFTSFAFSQNQSDSVLINLNSEGYTVNFLSQNFTNNISNTSSYNPYKQVLIHLQINSTAWKFSKKYNLIGMAEVDGLYRYHDGLEYGYNKNRYVQGKAFGGGDYYIANSFYSTASVSTAFSNGTTENVDNYEPSRSHKYSYRNAINYFWLGLGYGRIVNTASITKEGNFEQILKERKVLISSIPASVKKELDILIEKRNNMDFISKYKDDADAEFFGQVEKILRENGVIKDKIDAETTIRLYNSLINNRYLYYPNYSGYQIQLEGQYQMNSDIFNNFVIASGILGVPLSSRSNFLFSGFFSLPLNDHADAGGLFFNGFKTPFNNYIPVLAQKYKIENTDYLQSREYVSYHEQDMSYFAGGKAILFYKFDDFAGIRGYVSSVVGKPDTLSVTNASNIGAILDYNIFSHLTLNFQAEYQMTNRYKPFFYYNLGFLWNIL